MWSLGSVAVTLLTGGCLFADSQSVAYNNNPDEAILKAAAECNLSEIDISEKWKPVGERPKDFVRRLLVLDEVKRMTVKEALDHQWFTNEHHKDEFEAVYQRGIRHWRPRPKRADMIEIVDGPRRKKDLSTNTRPKRPSLSFSKRALIPIEPHYMPFHRHMNQLVSPRRKFTALPSITDDIEDSTITQSCTTQSTNTPSSLSTRQDVENANLSSLERLQLSDRIPPPPSKTVKAWMPLRDTSPLQQKAARSDLAHDKLPWAMSLRYEPLKSKKGNLSKFLTKPNPTHPRLDSTSKKTTPRATRPKLDEDETVQVQATPTRGKLARIPALPRRPIGSLIIAETPQKSRKRSISSVYDLEDDEVYKEVSESSAGWRGAADLLHNVYKRRKENDQENVPADLTDSIRTAI